MSLSLSEAKLFKSSLPGPRIPPPSVSHSSAQHVPLPKPSSSCTIMRPKCIVEQYRKPTALALVVELNQPPARMHTIKKDRLWLCQPHVWRRNKRDFLSNCKIKYFIYFQGIQSGIALRSPDSSSRVRREWTGDSAVSVFTRYLELIIIGDVFVCHVKGCSVVEPKLDWATAKGVGAPVRKFWKVLPR